MPARRHQLAVLIDAVKADSDISDEDIARRARRAGHQISKQHIANLRAQDPLKSLVPSTLRALAAGLEIPLGRVMEAALPSAGLPAGPPANWSAEAAIEADPQLPLPAKRILLRYLADARGVEPPARPPAARKQPKALTNPDRPGVAARRRPTP